jgi:hypothetical protein
MKTNCLSVVALVTGAFLLVPQVGHSQPVPAPTPAPPVRPPAAAVALPGVGPFRPEPIRFTEPTEQKRVEASFENVPLTEMVAWLGQEFPDVNFVMARSLVDSELHVLLRLRAAGLRDLLEAINIATDGAVGFDVRSPTLVALSLRSAPHGGLVAPRAEAAKAPEPPAMTYQVVNLREMLRVDDPAKATELLDTIRRTTEETLMVLSESMPEKRPRPVIKAFNYHPGSGVLVVIGQNDAIRVAMEVIRNSRFAEPGDAKRAAKPAPPAEAKPTTPAPVPGEGK